MPWCPDCRYEYVDGVQRCTDCGAALVDEEPTGKRPPKRKEAPYTPAFAPLPVPEGVPTELLLSLQTQSEADEIESALVREGVAVNREFLGVKRVTGFSLYVAEADVERAAELLEQAGLLQPVDESLAGLFEDDDGETDPPGQPEGAQADDLAAYHEASRSLPKGHPAPMAVTADTETALLTTVSSTFEADRIEAVIRQERIPVWRRNRHAGTAIQAVWGGTHLGVDLLVPKEMLQAACDALERLGLQPGEGGAASPADTEDSPELLDDSGYRRGRSARGWILLFFFFGGAAIGVLGLLVGLVRLLLGF